MAPSAVEAERKFYTCPAGHTLPHRTERGECSPLYCPGSTPGSIKRKEAALKDLAAAKKSDGTYAPPEKELAAIERAKLRADARRKLVPVPEGLAGADAEAWVQQRQVALAPLALAEQEYQLLFGDDEQRAKASARILDSTGHGKKESGNTAGPVIVINASGFQLPWRQTVEAKLVEPIGALPANAQKQA